MQKIENIRSQRTLTDSVCGALIFRNLSVAWTFADATIICSSFFRSMFCSLYWDNSFFSLFNCRRYFLTAASACFISSFAWASSACAYLAASANFHTLPVEQQQPVSLNRYNIFFLIFEINYLLYWVSWQSVVIENIIQLIQISMSVANQDSSSESISCSST